MGKLADRLGTAGTYLLPALGSIALSIAVMHLWRMNLAVPLYYSRGSDELFLLTLVKALIDDGWFLTITHLGAPFQMSLGDFPVPNLLHIAILRLLVLVIPDPAVATNIYFLLGFPLISIAATYLLVRLRFSRSIAMALGIVYAFLPMRFLRNIKHLFYSQYFMLPILVLALFLILRGTNLVDRENRRITKDGYLFGFGLFLVALDNQYDAVFCCIFLVFVGVASMIRYTDRRRGIAALFGIIIVVGGVFVGVAPNILYEHTNGKNQNAVLRPLAGAEVYGLTFSQLVLPIRDHRIPAFAQVRTIYDTAYPPLVNENESASLGLLGAAGFILGIATLLLRRSASTSPWEDAGRLNIVAFFLATVGGLGAIISYYYVPDLRAYNRISPLIAMFAFISIASALQVARNRWPVRFPIGWIAFLTVIVLIAVVDQTSNAYVPEYAADKALYVRDGQYARLLEAKLGPRAMIFQLPHVPFPESPIMTALDSYDESAVYVQSKGLRFSFGTTRGRADDNWIVATTALGTEQFIERVLLAGFNGISIYRQGYPDSGASEVAQFENILNEKKIDNGDGTISTFDLSTIRAGYVRSVGSSQAARAAQETIHPVVSVDFGTGFYGVERSGGDVWSWAPAQGTLVLTNPGDKPVNSILTFAVSAAVPRASQLTLTGLGTDLKTTITGSPRTFAIHVAIPPGQSSFQLSTNAARLDAGNDPRDIRFRITSWSVFRSDMYPAVSAVRKAIASRQPH